MTGAAAAAAAAVVVVVLFQYVLRKWQALLDEPVLSQVHGRMHGGTAAISASSDAPRKKSELGGAGLVASPRLCPAHLAACRFVRTHQFISHEAGSEVCLPQTASAFATR